MKCLNCEAEFEDFEVVEAIIDHHPYGEGQAAEYGCVCPRCGSAEIAEAFRCDGCGEIYLKEEAHYVEDRVLCPDCTEEYENSDSPHKGIDNAFDAVFAMLNVV